MLLGCNPTLPPKIEERIVNLATTAAEKGLGVSQRMLQVKTSQIVKRLNLNTSFSNNIPWKDWYMWYRGLQKRHPEIVIRRQEKLSHSRACMLNGHTVVKYMLDFNKLLTSLHLHNKPGHVYNMDETGLQMEHQPTGVHVLARKGTRAIPGRVSNSRENITIVSCVNAAGETIPPMFIAKGKTYKSLLNFKTAEAPPGSLFHLF